MEKRSWHICVLEIAPISQTCDGADVRTLRKAFGNSSCLEQACGVNALEIQTLQRSQSLAANTAPPLGRGVSRGLRWGLILSPPLFNTFSVSRGRQKMPRLWRSDPGTDTAPGAGCTASKAPDTWARGGCTQGGWGPPPKNDASLGKGLNTATQEGVAAPLQSCAPYGVSISEGGREAG